MSYTPEHKQKSRAKILGAASRLFAERGFENVTIDEVMAEAGMTRGAFYAHFKNKSALYAESITAAAATSRALDFLRDGSSLEQLHQLAKAYLSRDHVDGHSVPCPLGFLVTDVVNRDPQGRNAYTHVYQRFAARIAAQVPGGTREKEERAYGITALLIGGVALGRAIGDNKTVDALLMSCLKTVEQLLVDSSEVDR
jgi:TetR/AcrR family transcriptional repressor of nem operon